MGKKITILIICLVFAGCKRIKYTRMENFCVDGYYEKYETGGQSVSKSTATSNRVLERWVCTEWKTDSITDYKYIID